MVGQQSRTEFLSFYFRLEDQVPRDHQPFLELFS
jgi:hypothetical protein